MHTLVSLNISIVASRVGIRSHSVGCWLTKVLTSPWDGYDDEWDQLSGVQKARTLFLFFFDREECVGSVICASIFPAASFAD